MNHRFVPVSKELGDDDPVTSWKCQGCGTIRDWEDDTDGECPALSLFAAQEDTDARK